MDEYYEYLEDVEDKIFNLIEGINTDQIKREIEDYERQHKQEVANINSKKHEQMR